MGNGSKPMTQADLAKYDRIELGAQIDELERQLSEADRKLEEAEIEISQIKLHKDNAAHFARIEHNRVKELETVIESAMHKAEAQANAGDDSVLRFMRGCFSSVLYLVSK